MTLNWLEADWNISNKVKTLSTTRLGGISQPPWEHLNLGNHVGDNPDHVAHNREILIQNAHLPAEPRWLKQVHGCTVATPSNSITQADASYTNRPDEVCVVMTADCLPVLFSCEDGSEVAAAHAGWRGLASGVLENCLSHFKSSRNHIHAWLGPAIGPKTFQVGSEVVKAFCSQHHQAEMAFKQQDETSWLADIYQLAQIRLEAAGLKYISGGQYCTYSDSHLFYSYRRNAQTGRMASMIWIVE